MVNIRRAEAADAEAILAYCRLVGGETENLTFGAEGVGLRMEQEAAYLEGIRHSERQLYLVAEAEGEIIGTGVLSYGGWPRLAHRGEISISVKKAMWGQHIATRMLEEILRFAREQAKVRILSLEVRSDNARAIGLYRKFGFETVGRFPGFLQIDGEEVSCDLMRLHL